MFFERLVDLEWISNNDVFLVLGCEKNIIFLNIIYV